MAEREPGPPWTAAGWKVGLGWGAGNAGAAQQEDRQAVTHDSAFPVTCTFREPPKDVGAGRPRSRTPQAKPGAGAPQTSRTSKHTSWWAGELHR